MASNVWIVTAEYNGGELVSRVFDEESGAEEYTHNVLNEPYQVITPDMYPTVRLKTYLPSSSLRGVQIEECLPSAKDKCVLFDGGLWRISFNRTPDWMKAIAPQSPNGYQIGGE